MKTFLQWLKEDAPANNIGSGNIAQKPLPLGTILRRKQKKDGLKGTDRTGAKHTSGV